MTPLPLETVESWGRLPYGPSKVFDLTDRARVASEIHSANAKGIAYGNGRSYGDVCLNPGGWIWRTRRLDRFISFDAASGVIRCEAGVLLRDLIALVLPHGWFPAVTPGTQFVSIGGAIANDVHGKNHHRTGTFGGHVRCLILARTDGSELCCSRDENAELFAATIGGLGLTGVIVEAELALRRIPGPWMQVQTQMFGNLTDFFSLSKEADTNSEYVVGWVDCLAQGGTLGRGIFFSANHVLKDRCAPRARSRTVRFTPPVSLVNRLSLRPFNLSYYHAHRLRQGSSIQHFEKYFYPLDGLLHWNRIYGPRGFYQYQSVVPSGVAIDATRAMLNAISRSGVGSFLAVLKVFGDVASPGMLSFPMAGASLALDFPNAGTSLHALFDELDAIVYEAGGRIYAAKDARMPRELFRRGYPRVAEFLAHRDSGIDSAMARRLLS